MKTILIVDDEYAIVEALEGLLMDEGYQVLTAANGKEALAQVAKAPPDVVLTDVMMPVMGGRELVLALAADPSTARLPVVMTSAAPRAILFPGGLDLPIAAFLAKPFNVGQLLEVLDRLLVRNT